MKKSAILIIHTAYWLMFLLLLLSFFFFAVLLPYHAKPALQKTEGIMFGVRLMAGFAIIPSIISFYAFYYLLFKKFLSRKKFLSFFLWGFLVSLASALTGAAVESLPLLYGPRFLFGDGYSSAIVIIIFMWFIALLNGVIASVIKGFIAWYDDIKLKEALKQKNYDMEMALLKSTISPHFLFNTINNIDVLITKNAVMASAYLNKLSDIMRFMLYETNAENISLEKELAYIQKYIDLQKIRTSNPDYVYYNVEGNANGLFIAPMLFIPFIENAFKHAVNKKTGNAIRIEIIIANDMLIFNCENSYGKIDFNQTLVGGLGNELIRKRLLLLYPGKHTLAVTNNDGIYKVKLELYYNGN